MKINPIIEKELKVKMRGWKSPALITVYLGLLGLFVSFFFVSNFQASVYGADYFNPRIAINAYNALATLQFIMILLITPAMTAGAISGERERQTLDLLLCTNLSTLSIITGKVFVSIAHILLLITASLPIMGTVFLFGGIGITDLLLLFAFYLTTALMLGSIGIFFSTVFKKSSVSMVVSYITVIVLLVGTGLGLILWTFVTQGGLSRLQPPSAAETLIFMAPNPLFGFSSIVGSGRSGIFFLEIFVELRRYVNTSGFVKFLAQPWLINVIFNLVASVIFILLSSWKIKPVKKGIFRKRAKIGQVQINRNNKLPGSSDAK
jgi:ABC-2 type transport system permease protein